MAILADARPEPVARPTSTDLACGCSYPTSLSNGDTGAGRPEVIRQPGGSRPSDVSDWAACH
jgi:hypothetical protein